MREIRKTDSPGMSEFGLMVAFLRQNKPALIDQGEWNQIITEQIGGNPLGRDRGTIAEELSDWFFVFPKSAS